MSVIKSLVPFIAGALIGILGTISYDQYSVFAAYGSCRQSYPNIPGKLLLENDKVVVQRFVFPPGQWEGVHAHPANQLYIHIKGGRWTVRYGDRRQTFNAPTGSVGWFGPVHRSEDHESVNSGTEPIDLIWVTLKDGCAT